MAEDAQRPDASAPHGSFLLADGDADVRRVLACVLERAGYRVLQARDAAEALARLPEAPVPCVLVLDAAAPRPDGAGLGAGFDGGFLDAAAALQQAAGALHVVVLSAAREPPAHPLVRAALAKPFHLPQVHAALARVHAQAVAAGPASAR